MPDRPLCPCSKPGCCNLTRGRFCDEHEGMRGIQRQSAHKRGYTYQWRKQSKQYLAGHPWCGTCLKRGIQTPATLVDHIRPHKGDMRLFWDKSNWQGLCAQCHNNKTAKEDGGFGNPQGKKNN